jgi:hypothetical protein
MKVVLGISRLFSELQYIYISFHFGVVFNTNSSIRLSKKMHFLNGVLLHIFMYLYLYKEVED